MLTLSWHGHTLIGVPAIHNRAVFAEFVNRSCSEGEMRPDAIAVELDPAAVSAITKWLQELGVISGQPLPCMLGLIRNNRTIHPRFRVAALQLQESTGCQLHELSPELLLRELGYSQTSLLCLSPTDSIFEAIRCALELRLPLYGIDRDDFPHLVENEPLNMRDPLYARTDFQSYLDAHAKLVERIRDEQSDVRREIVMAARLKALLLRHERVLFTCGMAHWHNICLLLADDSLQPAIEVPQHGSRTYERVLVHPQRALAQMDILPAITASYEVQRQPVSAGRARRKRVNYQAAFQSCLAKACMNYSSFLRKENNSRTPENNHGLTRFSSYLSNLCLLSQQFTPDLYSALSAAKSMMPGEFVTGLTESLMEFSWASPTDFPHLPVITPETNHKGHGCGEAERAVMKYPRKRADEEQVTYENSIPFYVFDHHDNHVQKSTELTWKWQDEPVITTAEGWKYGFNFIWPPCEYLFYASIYEAITIADAQRQERRTELFSDSLQDGIDLKASLRSSLSGDNQLFVKRLVKTFRRPARGEPVPAAYTDQLELQPTVFIFSTETDSDKVSWQYLRPGDSELYNDFSARGKRMYDKVVASGRSALVESIHLAESQPVPEEMRPWVRGMHLLHGSVRFGNPCINFYQSAAWLEKGRFRSAPILTGSGSIAEIAAMYRQRHQINIDPEDWGNALILMALPYTTSTHRVVVVAPRKFRISKDVHQQARRCRVELFVLPLSHFPAERVSRIRRQYFVKTGQGGKTYPPELERVFGHDQYTYMNLLPQQIRRQTKARK